MASLFYLPKVTSLPGSKLYFYQTGTSTPQAVYTDEALSVAHTQPVVADASGVFAPIYFDGTVGSFRVSHYTSADVLIYTVDGVPSGPGNLVTGLVVAQTTNPRIRMRQKGATGNNADWVIQVASEQLKFSLTNSALSTEADYLVIDRTNNACDAVEWTTSSHKINGDESHRGAFAVKTTTVSRNTSTSLTADNELVLSMRGSSWYVIEGELYFDATTTAAMGFKFDMSYSGTLTLTKGGITQHHVNGTGSVGAMDSFPSTPVSFATITTSSVPGDVCRFSYSVQTNTAGTMSLRWAQNSSSGNNLNLRANSWLRSTRLV